MAGGYPVGNGMDRMTVVVMLVIIATIVEVTNPGTVLGLLHYAARQVGLP